VAVLDTRGVVSLGEWAQSDPDIHGHKQGGVCDLEADILLVGLVRVDTEKVTSSGSQNMIEGRTVRLNEKLGL
jgi:hypothetical protein